MSFMYPRLITITRPSAAIEAGAAGYQSSQAVEPTVIAQGVPANIQIDRTGVRPDPRLPGDTVGQPSWKVFTPPGLLPSGIVLDNDLIDDDHGRKFQVIANYDNSMGGAFRVQRMRT